jgi:protein-S-isoprenylcysteine O-methyltransferase Ste14
VVAQAVLGVTMILATLTRRGDALVDRLELSGLVWGFGVFGATLGATALLQMRRHLRVLPTPRDDAPLLRTGVYGRWRHPMYSAVLSLVAAMSLHHPSPAVLAVGGLNVALYVLKARYEEGLLLRHYPAYGEHRSRTWGLFPGF